MDKIDLSSFKGLYLKTAREYIDKLKQNIEILLNQPDNMDAINTIYISVHSLGSQSTLTNFKSMESINAIIEHIFLKIKEGNLKISEDLLTVLKDSIIGLTNCVDSIDKENKETDLSNIKEEVQKIGL